MPMLAEASLGLSSVKITDQHRARSAIVYVRQSTYKQVQTNREGQHNQYALVQRALELGWIPERVRIFDADQGHSGQDGLRPGAGAGRRPDPNALLQLVTFAPVQHDLDGRSGRVQRPPHK